MPIIKVKSNLFKCLRLVSELNAPNLYLSTKIVIPELLMIDKKMPSRIPKIKPINPKEHRINPSINPIEKYKILSMFKEIKFFIIW